MSSFWDVFGIPPTRIHVDITTFVSYVIPPVACYLLAAMLAITPNTRAIQLALWPVLVLLAFRAAVSVDFSFGNPENKSINCELLRYMVHVAIHSLSWATASTPPVRHLRPANSTPSTLTDALDLATNLRGHGWTWSRGLYIPHDTRPTHRAAFAAHTLFTLVTRYLISSACYRTVITLTTRHPGPPTLIDPTLPPLLRTARTVLLAALAATAVSTTKKMAYDAATLVGLALGQDPAQWPPLFDAPWRATSLSAFWGRRWHQVLRHALVTVSFPLCALLGPMGGVLAAFAASACWHYALLRVLDPQTELWRMGVGFGMMGVGVVLERAWYRVTGRRVGGVVGWLWTMGWLLVWGCVVAQGYVRSGLFVGSSGVDRGSPMRTVVARWAMGLDDWLHTV